MGATCSSLQHLQHTHDPNHRNTKQTSKTNSLDEEQRRGRFLSSKMKVSDGAASATKQLDLSCSYRGKLLHEHTVKKDAVYKFYKPTCIIGHGNMSTIWSVKKKARSQRGFLASLSSGGSSSRKHIGIVGSSSSNTSMTTVASTISSSSLASAHQHEYALKAMRLDRVETVMLTSLRNEISILRHLDHPNIVRTYETFGGKTHLYIIMEHCRGGSLHSRGPYSEEAAARIVQQILGAVRYLHKNFIVHRDIKHENIMFANERPDAPIKIIDFGLSTKYLSENQQLMKSQVGTLYTIAPEVVSGKGYSSKADLWSVGVVAYMLLSNMEPFVAEVSADMKRKIMQGAYAPMSGPGWENVSPEAKQFVASLLNANPEERFDAAQAHRDPWIQRHGRPVPLPLPTESKKKSEFQDRVVKLRAHLQNTYSCPHERTKFQKLAFMIIAHRSSVEELQGWTEIFEACDINGEGTLSLEGFARVFGGEGNKTMKILANDSFHEGDVDDDKQEQQEEIVEGDGGRNEEEKELRVMFDSMILNEKKGDEVIFYTEFLAAALDADGTMSEERVTDAFDRLDCDNSGYITKKNLRDFLGSRTTGEMIDDILEDVDKDKDGKISYQDFLNVFKTT